MKMSMKFIMISILFISIHFFIMPNKVNSLELVKNTEYYDWSELESIEQDYSFSTIYLSEKTEFIFHKRAGIIDTNTYVTASGIALPTMKEMVPGDELILQITNCAVNKDNELLDVVIKISNIVKYRNSSYNDKVSLEIREYIPVTKDQMNPKTYSKTYLDVGNPLQFLLVATYANCDFTMTYYKSGTYKYDGTTESGQLGNISRVNGFFGDIDIVGGTSFQNQFLRGMEGFAPTSGSSKIFYNRERKMKEQLNIEYQNFSLQELDNGIAVAVGARPGFTYLQEGYTSNPEGYWFGDSVLLLTDSLSDSTFSITYGGTECGISFFFSSPYPYDVTNPLKNVSKEAITPGEAFTYEISQYIPNNYYATVFDFKSIYSTSNENSRFSYLAIKDTFSNLLKIEEDSIYITDETGSVVNDKFYIVLKNNELVVSAKEENFIDSSFYSHTYTVHVPAVLKEVTKGVDSFVNVAVTAYKTGADEANLSSNEVTIDIIYKLIVNYLKEKTNEPVAESKTIEYRLNDIYTTDYPNINGLELVGIPDNASGIIIANTIVNYYYREPIPIIVDNPKTGANSSIVIASTIILIMIIIYFYLYKYKNLYKYE